MSRIISATAVKPKLLIQPQFKKYSLNINKSKNKELSEDELEAKAKQIYQWGKSLGATHYSLWAFPQTSGTTEKQELFVDLEYSYENGLMSKNVPKLTKNQLIKSEADGSSFPSEGLRVTHEARSYMVWDTNSQIFLRKRNNILYIPALMLAHDGTALDDKTLFRNSERILQNNCKRLLELMGIKAKGVFMALGMEQQFFIVPKKIVEKRLDIRQTGRALIGRLPPKNQQFSDHYYGKLPNIFEDILKEAERELLQLGVPVKTRHKQVALNQFQFCPLFQEAGKAIDHNMIIMDILKETFNRHGYTALFHQKPFSHANGSGKHCNWSLNYANEANEVHNLFEVPKNETQNILFRMFILINLQALLNYSKLYLASICCSGNELRLGGHEAPPRIISAFLGSFVNSILDGKNQTEVLNFKEFVPNINFNLLQENTDRNRTSPYAFAGNKFEFRAVGSSQNACFPMAVIAATMAKQVQRVVKKIENGESIGEILNELTNSTKKIRFEGNGYSQEWINMAKERGLYVNKHFFQNIENLKSETAVLVEIGACSEKYIQSKYKIAYKNYQNIVDTQLKTLKSILSREVVPRCFEYANTIDRKFSTTRVNNKSLKFMRLFDQILGIQQQIQNQIQVKPNNLKQIEAQRKTLGQFCERVTQILLILPKKDSWPEFEDFMNIY